MVTAPVAFCTMPRITSADAVCASLRCRPHTPREHITLTIPVSSSMFRNVTPCAVAGRCRWVTAPAISTRVPSRTESSRSAGTTPIASSFARRNCTG